MRLSRVSRGFVLGLAAIGLVGSSGCFGSFNATRKLYSFNKGVGDKWVQEIVFLAFTILPIYSIAGLVDVLVLNTIEFWTGDNPMTASSTTTTRDGTQLRQTQSVTEEERTLTIEEVKDGVVLSTTTMTMLTGSETITSTTTFADGRVETREVTRAMAEQAFSGR